MKAIALSAVIVLTAVGAHAQPSREQLRTAAKINTIVNGRRAWAELPAPCAVYALNKAWAFIAAGIDKDAVHVEIVNDESGELHAVAAIGEGAEALIYDSRFPRPIPRKDLETFGYRWVAAFTPDAAAIVP